MIKKYIYLLFIILCSCFYKSTGYVDTTINKFSFELITYNIDSTDSLELDISVKFPLKKLVFIKESGLFISNLEVSLKIEDDKSGSQLERLSWREKITKEFYDLTKESDSYYESVKTIRMMPGDYKFILGVKDLDSYRNWKIIKKKSLKPNAVLSKIRSYYLDSSTSKDAVKLVFQMLDTKIDLNDSIQYFLYKNSLLASNGYLALNDFGLFNKHYVLLEVNSEWDGEYEFTISMDEDSSSCKLFFTNNNNTLWSTNIYELVGVMHYILDFEDAQNLQAMSDEDVVSYIYSYWERNDSSPRNNKNELLEELKLRFVYVNKNFSIRNKGWETDRGAIYLIHGKPESIEEKYNYQTNTYHIIWHYPSGYKVAFIQVAMDDYIIDSTYTIY